MHIARLAQEGNAGSVIIDALAPVDSDGAIYRRTESAAHSALGSALNNRCHRQSVTTALAAAVPYPV